MNSRTSLRTQWDQARFGQKVQKTSTCWLWQGRRGGNADTYPYFKINGRRQRASRVIYVWTFGSIPDQREIDHKCRNRLCVNPNHLELVTHAENVHRRYHPVVFNMTSQPITFEFPDIPQPYKNRHEETTDAMAQITNHSL